MQPDMKGLLNALSISDCKEQYQRILDPVFIPRVAHHSTLFTAMKAMYWGILFIAMKAMYRGIIDINNIFDRSRIRGL